MTVLAGGNGDVGNKGLKNILVVYDIVDLGPSRFLLAMKLFVQKGASESLIEITSLTSFKVK